MKDFSCDSLSIVVPVFDEEENVRPLVEKTVRVGRSIGVPFEVIVVDDGSRDATLERLELLSREFAELVVLALRRNFGQTIALQSGMDRARGSVIVTMDGDLQNDPQDIPKLLKEIELGADVVSGWRRQRQDTLVVRKIPSWIANRLIRWITRVPVHDQGCSLKAYRRDVVRALDLYGDLHRFIAVLTLPVGAHVSEIEVVHHPRVAGQSKYGLSRVLKVLGDLAMLQLITRFRERPLRWFAVLSIPFWLTSFAMSILVPFSESPTIPVSLTLVFGMPACSFIVLGFLGELIVESNTLARTHPIVYRQWVCENND